jgi:hypothetical protein
VAKKTEILSPHRVIDKTQCPRCGGHHTECCGDDDTNDVMWVCLDCEAKDPDQSMYFVTYEDELVSVHWTVDDGTERGEMHEVYDTEHVTRQAAAGMYDVLHEFVTDVEAVGLDTLSCDWLDLAVTYEHAKAILAQARPPQDEKGA